MREARASGSAGHLFDCLFYTFVSMVWYKNLLFRCLPGRTYAESSLILWGLVGLSLLMCAFLLNRRRRTGWTLAASLIVPFGLYTVPAYADTVGWWMPAVLAASAMLAGVGCVFLMTRRICSRAGRHRVIRRRLHRCCVLSQSIAAAALSVVIGVLGVNGIFGNNILVPSLAAVPGSQSPPATIDSSIDTLLLLREETWGELATREKLDALQTVANIEARYLGLPNELNVGAANLAGDTLSSYNDATHTISIDLDHLEGDPAHEVLNSCCHEAYHSYQHRLVDAYCAADASLRELRIYRSAARYGEEFRHYADGSGSFRSYYYQDCEVDARDYAEAAVRDYYDRISEYLSGSDG